jgi:hypothetical protein
MRTIKKIIKRKLKLVPCDNEINCGRFIPDLNSNINFKFNLDSEFIELGFFEPVDDTEITLPEEITNGDSYIITGYSESRLNELKKYKYDETLENGYILLDTNKNKFRTTGLRHRSTGSRRRVINTIFNVIDQVGVILAESTEELIVYIINGITYYDDLVNGITTYSFERNPLEQYGLDYTNNKIIKNKNHDSIIDKPIVKNDILIDRLNRGGLSDIYRFNDIDRIETLVSYGGNYFNIKKDI